MTNPSMRHTELLTLQTIGNAPAAAGIYAWYYRPSLTDCDINELISGIKNSTQEQAIESVIAFLTRHLLKPFAESAYRCELQGQLKPRYTGVLNADLKPSMELVKRIASDPERLWKLKATLDCSVPRFASPIYIGMTNCLRQRLLQHKTRIEKFQQKDLAPPDPDDEDQVCAHSFASQVHERRFLPNWLLVAVQPIESKREEQKDAENVLNRINFPICGRN